MYTTLPYTAVFRADRGRAPAGGGAHQLVDPRQQLLDVEGLDQVIVGTLLEPVDLVLPARARSEDQHRELLAFLAQLLDKLHAGHLGQAEVDDADVERHLAPHVPAFLAVLGGVHRERTEENTSELQSLMRLSFDVFRLQKNN